jgi:hypothetical protein
VDYPSLDEDDLFDQHGSASDLNLTHFEFGRHKRELINKVVEIDGLTEA